MLHEEIKAIRSSRRDFKQFGLVLGGVLVLFGIWLFLKKNNLHEILIAAGAGLILVGLFAPGLLKPFQRVWMILAVILGWFMTRLILSGLFFIILTPTALLARWRRKPVISMKPDPSRPSYWIFREQNREDDWRVQF